MARAFDLIGEMVAANRTPNVVILTKNSDGGADLTGALDLIR